MGVTAKVKDKMCAIVAFTVRQLMHDFETPPDMAFGGSQRIWHTSLTIE